MSPEDPRDGEEIVYAFVRTDSEDPSEVEPRTKTVSPERYESIQHASKTLQDFKDDWMDESGIRSIGLGGDDFPSIVVTVDRTNPDIEEEIPDSVEGISVQIRVTDPDAGELL